MLCVLVVVHAIYETLTQLALVAGGASRPGNARWLRPAPQVLPDNQVTSEPEPNSPAAPDQIYLISPVVRLSGVTKLHKIPPMFAKNQGPSRHAKELKYNIRGPSSTAITNYETLNSLAPQIRPVTRLSGVTKLHKIPPHARGKSRAFPARQGA